MRKIILFAVIIGTLAAALAIYLIATIPRSTRALQLPLPVGERDLLASVPEDAEAFALIPDAAAVRSRLEANPMTREALEAWSERVWVPQSWMLGGADLVIWQSPQGTGYAFHLDGVRSIIVRSWLAVSGADVHLRGSTVVVGAEPVTALGRAALDPILTLADSLPRGDALLVQRSGEDSFPPVARPAVSVVSVEPGEITIFSRARDDDPAAGAPRAITLPRGALLSAWFGEPPRVMRDIDRLLPGDVVSLITNGGIAVLYDVESSRLLPRPKGLFSIPATPEAREAARGLSGLAELLGEVAERDGRILIAFDRTSLASFERERMASLPFPASEWSVRIDAGRMVPALEDLGDHAGLRFAAARLSRSIRDLRSWLRYLHGAGQIEAALTSDGRHEELRVRVTAK